MLPVFPNQQGKTRAERSRDRREKLRDLFAAIVICSTLTLLGKALAWLVFNVG